MKKKWKRKWMKKRKNRVESDEILCLVLPCRSRLNYLMATFNLQHILRLHQYIFR